VRRAWRAPHSRIARCASWSASRGRHGRHIARILANALGPILGQQVIRREQAGRVGKHRGDAAIYAEPDGPHVLFGIFSLAVAPALTRLSYDTAKDLTAVSQVASVPLLMFAGGKTPFNSVATWS